jgi:hypothetical protein
VRRDAVLPVAAPGEETLIEVELLVELGLERDLTAVVDKSVEAEKVELVRRAGDGGLVSCRHPAR